MSMKIVQTCHIFVALGRLRSDSSELEVKVIDFSMLSFFGVKVSRTRRVLTRSG